VHSRRIAPNVIPAGKCLRTQDRGAQDGSRNNVVPAAHLPASRGAFADEIGMNGGAVCALPCERERKTR